MKRILFAVIAAAIANAPGASVHTGLLNYWPLDGNADDIAGNFAESTGLNASNGSIQGAAGTVGFATGLFGDAADFERDNGTDGRIEILDAAAGTDTDRSGLDMTLSFWVNVESFGTNWQAMVAHGEGADYRVARSGGSNNVAYAGGAGDITATGDVNDSGWHHIVATTTNGGAVGLTIDGTAGFLATGAGPAGIAQNSIAALYLGNNPGSTSRMHDGLLDDVAMWDRVLTGAEIDEIHAAGLAGTSLGAIPEPTTGLLGLLGLSLIFRRRR